MFGKLVLDKIDVLLMNMKYIDINTMEHMDNVCYLVKQIIKQMDIAEREAEKIVIAAKLHDIGKIFIDDKVLKKPGRLNKDEYEHIKLHSDFGAKILESIEISNDVSEIVLHHHERYDGKGYPGGLRGSQIPTGSRIIAVADSYDAMTRKRPYRDPYTKYKAVQEILRNSGTQFDPIIVNAFLNVVKLK